MTSNLKNTDIRKILVISLSNIGDVILTFPVLDILRTDFSMAEISIVVGPKAEPLFKDNPCFNSIFVFDKHQPFLKTLHFLRQLRADHYDLIVDLRNTAIPFFIGSRHRTSFVDRKNNIPMRLKHLNRLKTVYAYSAEPKAEPKEKYCLVISEKDRVYIDRLLAEEIGGFKKIIVVAPGAANGDKRWTQKGFQEICDYLVKKGADIIFVGDQNDGESAQGIQKLMREHSLNLCGRLTLIQLAELCKRSALVVSNDSAPMHLASYLDCPVLAIFGPTDPQKYGPWSKKSYFLRKNETCLKCQNKKLTVPHACMEAVHSEDVIKILNLIQNDETRV